MECDPHDAYVALYEGLLTRDQRDARALRAKDYTRFAAGMVVKDGVAEVMLGEFKPNSTHPRWSIAAGSSWAMARTLIWTTTPCRRLWIRCATPDRTRQRARSRIVRSGILSGCCRSNATASRLASRCSVSVSSSSWPASDFGSEAEVAGFSPVASACAPRQTLEHPARGRKPKPRSRWEHPVRVLRFPLKRAARVGLEPT